MTADRLKTCVLSTGLRVTQDTGKPYGFIVRRVRTGFDGVADHRAFLVYDSIKAYCAR